MNKSKLFRLMKILVGAGIVVFLLIQLVPYGKSHSNPPITGEPKWDSPETRAIVKRGCFGCHSNEAVYPWYAYVAPSSWLLEMDISQARNNYNFSEWDPNIPGDAVAQNIAKQVETGKMPPWQYLLMHPEANFTPAEKQQLILGMKNTLLKK